MGFQGGTAATHTRQQVRLDVRSAFTGLKSKFDLLKIMVHLPAAIKLGYRPTTVGEAIMATDVDAGDDDPLSMCPEAGDL